MAIDDRNLEAPWIGDDDYGASKRELVHVCECCDAGIYEGEEYYDIEGYIVCEACIHEYKKTAEA